MSITIKKSPYGGYYAVYADGSRAPMPDDDFSYSTRPTCTRRPSAYAPLRAFSRYSRHLSAYEKREKFFRDEEIKRRLRRQMARRGIPRHVAYRLAAGLSL